MQLWHYTKTSGRDESAVPRACCDTVNRGLSYADGKLVFGTLDGYVIALDAITGKEIWVVKHAHPDKGETLTPAPIIANDKVIIGFGGDEFAARGRITAYNLADGKKVWECHSTGSDKDVCLTPNTNKKNPHYGTAGKDLGIHTYPGDEWQRGGGTAWGWYAYDPELHLVYYATGNPGLWSPSYRCDRADIAGELQQRQVRQQVVDEHFRAQRRYRRSRMGLSDDSVRPVGLRRHQ